MPTPRPRSRRSFKRTLERRTVLRPEAGLDPRRAEVEKMTIGAPPL